MACVAAESTPVGTTDRFPASVESANPSCGSLATVASASPPLLFSSEPAGLNVGSIAASPSTGVDGSTAVGATFSRLVAAWSAVISGSSPGPGPGILRQHRGGRPQRERAGDQRHNARTQKPTHTATIFEDCPTSRG